MALQTFYHLCHWGFIDEKDSELIVQFVAGARPRPAKAEQGIYVQTSSGSFLSVCGRRFHHRDVPVVPILHVKSRQRMSSNSRYMEPMQRAHQEIRQLI
jgi:hypothetical protein